MYVSTQGCNTGLGGCGCEGTCGGGPLGLGATPKQNWFNTVTQYRYYNPYSEREQERIANRWYYGPGYRRAGLGVFDSGFDPSSWGMAEWGIVALGGYALISVLFTTQRAARRVARIPGERRKSRAKRYREKAAALSKR